MNFFTKSLLTITAAGVLLTGCAPKETTKETLWDTVQSKGELKVGTEGTYPPFTYHDESGKLVGFDVEVAQEVGKRLGVKITFVEGPWDSLFAGLDANRFDMIANQVGIKPERTEKYDFSNAYIASSAALVTGKKSDITSLASLKGKKTAQSLTSNYGEMAKASGAEIIGVEGFAQAITLIEQGRVDATINDYLTVLDYQKSQSNANINVIPLEEDASESGLMFQKGNEEIVDKVNEALDAMKKDGTLAKISVKYFNVNLYE
ncbi:MAG: amino acid ABC transporter substrate-binding protein [Bacilli bacterium]